MATNSAVYNYRYRAQWVGWLIFDTVRSCLRRRRRNNAHTRSGGRRRNQSLVLRLTANTISPQACLEMIRGMWVVSVGVLKICIALRLCGACVGAIDHQTSWSLFFVPCRPSPKRSLSCAGLDDLDDLFGGLEQQHSRKRHHSLGSNRIQPPHPSNRVRLGSVDSATSNGSMFAASLFSQEPGVPRRHEITTSSPFIDGMGIACNAFLEREMCGSDGCNM